MGGGGSSSCVNCSAGITQRWNVTVVPSTRGSYHACFSISNVILTKVNTRVM